MGEVDCQAAGRPILPLQPQTSREMVKRQSSEPGRLCSMGLMAHLQRQWTNMRANGDTILFPEETLPSNGTTNQKNDMKHDNREITSPNSNRTRKAMASSLTSGRDFVSPATSKHYLSSTVQQLVGSVPLVNCKICDMIVQFSLDSGNMVSTVSSTFFDKYMKDKVGKLKDHTSSHLEWLMD